MLRIRTRAEARALNVAVPDGLELRGANKFHAEAIREDGFYFQSTGERDRYRELRLLERAGEILHLQVHPAFPLVVGADRECVGHYVADFSYRVCAIEAEVIEDFKSGPTRTPLYRLKRALMHACYGVWILETGAGARGVGRPARRKEEDDAGPAAGGRRGVRGGVGRAKDHGGVRRARAVPHGH